MSDLLVGKEMVIFDFDGVIADSEVLSLSTLQTSLRAFGIDHSLEETRRAFLGTSMSHIVDFVGRHGTGSAADFPAHWENALFDRFKSDLGPVPHLVDTLGLLDHLDLQFCIASSGTFRRIGIALDVMGLRSRFDHVFSAEQVQRGKPAPDVFLFAAAKRGVAPANCLVIEDSPHGIQAACAAGMHSVGFVGGSHVRDIAQGHGQLLLDAGADMVLHSYAGLSASAFVK